MVLLKDYILFNLKQFFLRKGQRIKQFGSYEALPLWKKRIWIYLGICSLLSQCHFTKGPQSWFFCSCTFSNHLTESHRKENFDVSVLFLTKVLLKANQVTGCHLRMTPCSYSEALQECMSRNTNQIQPKDSSKVLWLYKGDFSLQVYLLLIMHISQHYCSYPEFWQNQQLISWVLNKCHVDLCSGYKRQEKVHLPLSLQ